MAAYNENTYDVVLAAGETQTLSAGGRSFYIQDSDGSFEISIESNPFFKFFQGQGRNDIEAFEFLRFKNTSGSANTLTVQLSSGSIILANTEESLNTIAAILQDIDDNTDQLELKADTVILNTDELEALLDPEDAVTEVTGSATTTAADALAAGSRKFLVIQNTDSANDLHISFGGTATTSSFKLVPNGTFLLEKPNFIPNTAVNLRSSSGTAAYVILHA